MWTRKDIFKKTGILVLCNAIYPDVTGGAEIHVFELCRELAKRGHRVFVVYPATKFSNKVSDTKSSFARICLRLWPTPFATLSYIIKGFAAGFRLRQQIDIVHAHTADSPMAAAFLFSLISHKPYIVSCMGSDIRITSRNLLRRILQIPFLHEAENIVAVSNEICEILERKYGIPKCRMLAVGSGYDQDIRREIGDIRLRAETDRSMRIINVGNMRPVKDHMTLLAGFKKLTERMKEVHLSLVGDGPLRRQLEEFCIQQSIHDVEFLGRLPNHVDVLKHIANSDVFVLTSVEEGFPNVIIEALALGKPVIATAVGGIPEVVKEGVNGILIPPKSPEHVAKALERLLSDSILRKKLGEASAESVEDYTWSKIAEKYEKIYSVAVKRRRTQSNLE
jgi:glycosyltransferase involved in cell wall biosynthesis